MALTVATNTGALMAQAAASSVNKDMELSMERLSTGKRINSASDDAAGIAISSRLTSEIRGTNQAIRNAMDAQAMIDTAEGAHSEIENILQRMRELAVQSANDTNSSTDRTNLNTELNQLSAEIDRIASVTSWAGKNLLDGTASALNFQIGSGTASANQLSVSITAMNASALSVADGSAAAVSATSALSDTTFATSVSGDVLTISTAASGQAAVSAQDATAAVSERQQFASHTPVDASLYVLKDSDGNEISSFTSDATATLSEIVTGLTGGTDGAGAAVTVSHDGTNLILDWGDAIDKGLATLEVGGGVVDESGPVTTETISLDTTSTANDGAYSTTADEGHTLTVTTNGVTTTLSAATGSAYSKANLVAAFQADSDYENAGFTIELSSDDIIVRFNDYGTGTANTASLATNPVTTTNAAELVAGEPLQAAVTAQDLVAEETVTITLGSDNFEVELDTATHNTEALQATQIAAVLNADSTFAAQYSAVAVGTTVTFTGLDDTFNITTAANAESAIGTIDTAIQSINSQRATLGSYSNRLDSTVSNLTNISSNLQAGRGRIEDADFAAETTSLAKSQILQQASTAMLAQANASKQNVLSLLQG